jgi:hypothetical protein
MPPLSAVSTLSSSGPSVKSVEQPWMIDDPRVAEHAASLAAELDNLAARKEVVDRQFV